MKHFPPKVVVVATDLSEASQSAIDAAAWLAEAHGATLHLVHVYDPLPFHAPTALQGPEREQGPARKGHPARPALVQAGWKMFQAIP